MSDPVTFKPPPEGWFAFGTHVDTPGPLEFSDETDEAGMPLWERPSENDALHLCSLDCPQPCPHDPTAKNDAALAALGRLFDQVIHTAGDDAGRTRATEDMWTIHDALTRVIPPGKEKSHE
jgi:hypothetical protein